MKNVALDVSKVWLAALGFAPYGISTVEIGVLSCK